MSRYAGTPGPEAGHDRGKPIGRKILLFACLAIGAMTWASCQWSLNEPGVDTELQVQVENENLQALQEEDVEVDWLLVYVIERDFFAADPEEEYDAEDLGISDEEFFEFMFGETDILQGAFPAGRGGFAWVGGRGLQPGDTVEGLTFHDLNSGDEYVVYAIYEVSRENDVEEPDYQIYYGAAMSDPLEPREEAQISLTLAEGEEGAAEFESFFEDEFGFGFLPEAGLELYQLGDRGPAGGLIVFVDEEDEFGDFTYLEAAPAGWSGEEVDPAIQWSTTHVDGFIGLAGIGEGEQNTSGLVAAAGEDAPAAYATVEAEIGGFDDWFLPSIAELEAMYEVLHAQDEPLGFFEDQLYWSSTHGEGVDMQVDALDFSTGDRVSGPANYDEQYRVRPIRAF